MFSDKFIEHALAIGGAADVCEMPRRLSPHLRDAGNGLFSLGVTFNIVDAHVGALLRERGGNARAYSSSRTGDERFLSVQSPKSFLP